MATTIKIKNSSVAGKVPGDSDLNVAELGLNLADKKLSPKTDRATFSDWCSRQVPSGDTAGRPGSPSVGDLYFDTDLDLLIYWNGSEWVEVGAGGSEVLVQDSPPATTDLEEGTLWWNSDADDLRLYVLYNDPAPDAGLKWVQATPTSGSGGGVTSIIAGDGISVNQATGDVTVSVTDDGSGYVKLDDGGVKQEIVGGGGLTVGGNVTIGSNPYQGTANGSLITASGGCLVSVGSGSNETFLGYTTGTTAPTFKVLGDGSATFQARSSHLDPPVDTTHSVLGMATATRTALLSVATAQSSATMPVGRLLAITHTKLIATDPRSSRVKSHLAVLTTLETVLSSTRRVLLGIRKDGLEAGVIQVLNGGSTTDEETVSIANTGSAGFGLNANWAGAFFGIRKGTNNWAQHISIDSTSTAPSGFLVSVGVDNPTGGTALLCQKGVPDLGVAFQAISSKLIGTAMRFSAPLFKPAELKLATQQLASAAMHLQPRLQVLDQRP